MVMTIKIITWRSHRRRYSNVNLWFLLMLTHTGKITNITPATHTHTCFFFWKTLALCSAWLLCIGLCPFLCFIDRVKYKIKYKIVSWGGLHTDNFVKDVWASCTQVHAVQTLISILQHVSLLHKAQRQSGERSTTSPHLPANLVESMFLYVCGIIFLSVFYPSSLMHRHARVCIDTHPHEHTALPLFLHYTKRSMLDFTFCNLLNLQSSSPRVFKDDYRKEECMRWLQTWSLK